MRASISSIFFSVLLLVQSLAAANDECDFDQDERVRSYLLLEKKYPGSRYLKDEYRLVIPRGADEITLSIGGCVHYGVLVELKTKKTTKFDSEEALMKVAIDLVKEYAQDIIEHKRVEKIVAQKDWNDLASAAHDYYLLNYDDLSTFEVYRRNEGDFTIVGVNYYQ